MIKIIFLLTILLGLSTSATINLDTSSIDGNSCTGQIDVTPVDVVSDFVYEWSWEVNSTTYNSVIQGESLKIYEILKDGTYTIKLRITGKGSDGNSAQDLANYATITLQNCPTIGQVNLTNDFVNNSCEGSITATSATVKNDSYYIWQYTDQSSTKNISDNHSSILQASDIEINGSYELKVWAFGNNQANDAYAQDYTIASTTITLANCPDLGTATLDNKIIDNNCTGTIDATAEKVQQSPIYTWIYINQAGEKFTSNNKTSTFNASDIDLNGTYYVQVIIEGTKDGSAPAKDYSDKIPITLGQCIIKGKTTTNNTISDGTCKGTIVATADVVKKDLIYTWKYTKDSVETTSPNKTDTFNATDLSLDGNYSIIVIIDGKLDDGTTVAQDTSDPVSFTLGSCPTIGKATIDKTSFTDGQCTGTFLAQKVNVVKSPIYKWQYTLSGNTPQISSNISDTFNVSDIGVDGSYSMVLTIEGFEDDGITVAKDVSDSLSFTLGSCPTIGKATINKTFTDGQCTGTFQAQPVNVQSNPTYKWEYTQISKSTQLSTNISDTFNASDIQIDGSYNLVLTIDGFESDGNTVAKDVSDPLLITLGSCPLFGDATLNKVFTDGSCTGTIQVGTLQEATQSPIVYAWSWSGTSTKNSLVDIDTFDVSEIKVNGTYEVSVTITDVNGNYDTAKENITLGNCSVSPDDNNKDESSQILGIVILLFITIIL